MNFVVSEKWIDACKTPKGGWTRAQLSLLGVDWPPQKGWKNQVIGMMIDDKSSEQFEQLAVQ